MQPDMVFIAQVLNGAVTEGFMPAAQALGYRITLITDHGLAYGDHFNEHPQYAPAAIVECDVFNPLAIIEQLHARGLHPQLVFSNSDHLQASAALVAAYYGLPGKDWRCCYRAKNKRAMRQHLAQLQLPSIWSALLQAADPLPAGLTFPVVAKPCEGVAGLDVVRCDDADTLQQFRQSFHCRAPATGLLLESFIEGPLFTLETLGDGQRLVAIGGFDVTLSAPPHFVELQAEWRGPVSQRWQRQALAQLEHFGVGLGACHSEFIATANGPVLVEINYRSVGDRREFLLDQLLPNGWFETILRLHAGQPLAPLTAKPASALIRYLPATQSGQLRQISDSKHCVEQGISYRYQRLKQPGEPLQLSHSNKDYLGVITATADGERQLTASVDQFAQQLTWEVQA